jgi:glucose-1-phosphate adenylyltransferase
VHFLNHDFEVALILSGDQLYRMDYRQIIEHHISSGAELTVATIPVGRQDAQSFGIMHTDPDLRITRFVEKPKEDALLDSLRLPPEWESRLGLGSGEERFLASMGIYVFNRSVLMKLLDNDFNDFGKHIIPDAITTHRVFAYVYQGYWEDLGTIRSFFEANLNLTTDLPRFNFFDMSAPIFTRPRFLPASKINGARIDHAIVSDGCIVNHASITNSGIGVRSLLDRGAVLDRVVHLGSDYFESEQSIRDNLATGRPKIGIGENTRIENAIIDKNARIGSNCVITPAGKPDSVDHPLYYIRDGIVIIPKNGVVPDGTTI